MTSADANPGTWRLSDNTKVNFDVAKEAWSLAAREILMQTARKYHAYITYGELAEEVQKNTGIYTRSQMRNWIGAVLGKVALECNARGEAPLTSLCVHQDGTVGVGYAFVVALSGKEHPEDLDGYAAEDRLACYRSFGADLPADGGRAALTPKVAAARIRALKQVDVQPRLCPKCYLQVPANGHCDTCE